MNLEYASGCRYANEGHTSISMTVKFSHIPEDVPFTASIDDVEPHGVEIYNRAINGDFGPIAEYQPITYTIEQLARSARSERDRLLKECDWTQLSDIPEATRLIWVPYRQALRDIPQQEGFPGSHVNPILWPTSPTV